MFDPKNKLFIIDGMSLLFRSFYAMGTRLTTPKGDYVGAVYGFLRVIFKLLKEHEPTHFAVCWDLKEKTFRHEIFPDYKAHRGETPAEIIPQITLVKELLQEMKIPSFSMAGFEADDLAATLATFYSQYGLVYLVTSDKDYMQVLNDRIFMLSLKKGDDFDIINTEKVYDYFGVAPESVTNLLAIVGDTADNIPGVKGIGQKTAAKLISVYNNIENLYDHWHDIPNKKSKELLENEKENLLLYRYLVTLKTSVPISVTEDQLRYTLETLKTHSSIQKKLLALRMVTLVDMIFPDEKSRFKTNQKSEKKFSEALYFDERKYHLLQSHKECKEIINRIYDSKTNWVAFDTETTGLDIISDLPIGFSLSFEDGHSYFIPAHDYLCEKLDYSASDIWKALSKSFEKTQATIVGHNLKYDFHMISNLNVALPKKFACTMILAWLENSTMAGSYGLDALTLKHFGHEKIPTSQLIGPDANCTSMLDVPIEELSKYACEDALATAFLWQHYRSHFLEHSDESKNLFFEIEMPTLELLFRMEHHGVYVDAKYLGGVSMDMENELVSLEKEIFAHAKKEFKITSPKQLGEVLFDDLRIHEEMQYTKKLARTTLGYKTDAKVLSIFGAHPFVKMIQAHREISKLLGTYVLALPKLIHPKTGRVHTQFHQIGTATGRLSSSHPNLQNIPIRSELGKRVRAAFQPQSHDFRIISADYSQIELRLLAHMSGDKNMIGMFLSGADFHTITAAKILDKSADDVTELERSRAKAVNFGIIYGMGPQRLSEEQKISLSTAKEFINQYFQLFPKVKEFLDLQRNHAKNQGWVSTLFGRKRRLNASAAATQFELRQLENIAINSPVQGTAADIMKLAMIAVQKALVSGGFQAQIILQVHDELVLEVPSSEVDAISSLLQKEMQNVVEFAVPMTVEVGVGENWLKA